MAKINPDTWVMPQYEPYFLIDWMVDKFAENVYDQVQSKVKTGMNLNDTRILVHTIINAGHGDHLEIGSLFGGSAIIAALTKRQYGLAGNVYCVDDQKSIGKDCITDNLKLFEVNDRVILYVTNSNPLPVKNRVVSTLIDAGHDYKSCITDFNNAKQITDRYIIIHDYDSSHPGVVQASREAMREWMPVHLSEHTLVLAKPVFLLMT